MGIRITGVEETKKYIMEQADILTNLYLEELDRLAMKVVTAIRASEVSFWNDDTGNLRSSIGYVIMYDGKVRFENFQTYNGKGQDGAFAAKSFAYEIASRYPKGIALVIVAGMEYASYVEAIESRNVLAGGELLAKDLFRDLNAKWNEKHRK